jgi:hypothetical protein
MTPVMKTPAFITLWLLTAASPHVLGNKPRQQPSMSQHESPHGALLSRHDWHSLSGAAKQMEHLLHQAQTVRTRVWPHAVRDASGRAGLIIMAQRPLLMSMNAEDLDARQAWVLVSVLAAAKESDKSPLPLDHLALTDTEGAQGQPWYYDVEMSLARRLYIQLKERKITMDTAYREIVRSWRLVTAPHESASH